MPAYTHLRTFIDAVKTGRTHITRCLDDFFVDLSRPRSHPRWDEFVSGDWSAAPPPWLGAFLDEIGLTPAERDHVLCYPAGELERTRSTAADASNRDESPEFRWGLYDGDEPRVTIQGSRRILFESPGSSLRLTRVNYGEIYVEDV